MSVRLRVVVGVAESVGATAGCADTLTVSLATATLICKCTTGSVPDATRTSCILCTNPELATVTEYSPIGTAANSKLPSASVMVLFDQSDDFAFNITAAPWIGRCCGSWMIPRTEPKIVALAEAASRSKPQTDKIR